VTDYDQIRDGLQKAIPFNTHLGLEVVEVSEGKGVVRLPDEDKLHNHVGSQHAGGLFAAGEAASGGAFVGAFAEHMGGITALAKSADIEYRKLAKGAITATGTLELDAKDIIDGVDGEEGKAEFPVEVEMKDESGQVVATMTVHWHVRRTES
jgi:acyl-coenzyme A thioesterase PaaI-like protein